MKQKELKAIIFDMDGVLVDSEPMHLVAVQKLMERYGVTYTEKENREFLGRKDVLIADVLIKRYSLPLTIDGFIDAKEEILSHLIRQQAVPLPGVKKVLSRACELGVPMAIASSATMRTIKLTVETLSIIQFFNYLCSGEEVEHSKPAPDVFLLAASRLGLAPASCMVIEDSQPGLIAANAAGMFSVAIPCAATAFQDHSMADLRLASLEELCIDEIFGDNFHAGGPLGGKSTDCRR